MTQNIATATYARTLHNVKFNVQRAINKTLSGQNSTKFDFYQRKCWMFMLKYPALLTKGYKNMSKKCSKCTKWRLDDLMRTAAVIGNTDTVRFLITRGAGVNSANTYGHTALMGAVSNNYTSTARALIMLGANVNAATKNGGTALMWAAEDGHEDAVRLLLEYGANINATTTQYCNTALMLAVEKAHIDIVRLLLKSGANVNLVNTVGETALSIATRKKHSAIAKMLIEHGAIHEETNLSAQHS